MIKSLNVHNLNLIQVRAATSETTVVEYAGALIAGAKFPPIGVVTNGVNYWVWDGVHRYLAKKMADEAKRKEQEQKKEQDQKILSELHLELDLIEAEVTNGTHDDAVRKALGANATHGLRRTQADIAMAIKLALRSWPTISSREIARICGVSPSTVDAHRPKADAATTRVGADGKSYPATQAKKAEAAPGVQVGHLKSDGMPPDVEASDGDMVPVTTPPVQLSPNQAEPYRPKDPEMDEVREALPVLGGQSVFANISSFGNGLLGKARQDFNRILTVARQINEGKIESPDEATRAELQEIERYWLSYQDWLISQATFRTGDELVLPDSQQT